MAALGSVLLASWRRGGCVRLGTRTKEDEDLPDALDRVGSQRLADIADQALAMAAIISKHSDFDELVALQCKIDLRQYGGREAGFADHDDRMQMMSARPQGASLGRCQFLHVCKS